MHMKLLLPRSAQSAAAGKRVPVESLDKPRMILRPLGAYQPIIWTETCRRFLGLLASKYPAVLPLLQR